MRRVHATLPDVRFVPWPRSTPARSRKVGAQRCVTHRMKKKSGPWWASVEGPRRPVEKSSRVVERHQHDHQSAEAIDEVYSDGYRWFTRFAYHDGFGSCLGRKG